MSDSDALGPLADDLLIDRLASVGRDLLDAEEANRLSPTLQNTSRLARARRAVEDAIEAADERDERLRESQPID